MSGMRNNRTLAPLIAAPLDRRNTPDSVIFAPYATDAFDVARVTCVTYFGVAATGALAVPLPATFCARTVKLYDVPLVRPVTTALRAVPSVVVTV